MTTFAAFVPCFFFIFAFAPLIEKLENNQNLKAVLSGVTAAVVYHDRQFDYFALFLTIVSLIVLLRFKIDVMWIVLGGGLPGLLFEILNKI